MNETTYGREYSTECGLYLALELGQDEWKLGFTVGMGEKVWKRRIGGGDLVALEREMGQARKRFGLRGECRVVSCYEAGRDGFWLHRYLEAQGVESLVVDSASIEVNRRAKRAKTDGLDVEKLVRMLVRFDWGERQVWRVVHVPSREAEDKRHLHRQLGSLKVDRTRHLNRIHGLLATQGVRMAIGANFLSELEGVRLWDGTRLLAGLCARLEREYGCLQYVEQQIQGLEVERRELLRTSSDASVEQVRHLMRLRGIGVNSAWLFVMEFFGWRDFRNRRQVGALAGLCATPYQSGGQEREQGISKAGNPCMRAMTVEIAWCWLRFQPQSELSGWYWQRFGHGSKRLRKIGIVALARKLLVALWRYLEYGEVPAGAHLQA